MMPTAFVVLKIQTYNVILTVLIGNPWSVAGNFSLPLALLLLNLLEEWKGSKLQISLMKIIGFLTKL